MRNCRTSYLFLMLSASLVILLRYRVLCKLSFLVYEHDCTLLSAIPPSCSLLDTMDQCNSDRQCGSSHIRRYSLGDCCCYKKDNNLSDDFTIFYLFNFILYHHSCAPSKLFGIVCKFFVLHSFSFCIKNILQISSFVSRRYLMIAPTIK